MRAVVTSSEGSPELPWIARWKVFFESMRETLDRIKFGRGIRVYGYRGSIGRGCRDGVGGNKGGMQGLH